MTVPAFNSVAWFEFGTDRPEKVREFYGELFDWNYVLNTNTLGAEVLMESVSDSAGFAFARLRDTAGNHFGVFSAPAP